MRWLAVWILGSVAVVAAAAALLLTYVVDLAELAQWATVAAVAVGLASIAVAVWAARRPGGRASPAPEEGGVSNRIDGRVSGTAIQAGTITGGVTATSHAGDHIDLSRGTFHGSVAGKNIEQRRADRAAESTDEDGQ
ncbi:hypothetical protein ACFQZ2_00655 [Streptomonospora algeriensis]|uniref:NfeD-like C-terminal domain-containing protein n=1 Tax=Streptomonospora algeriensis TaxID=995084 RepID=A0ABW3B9R7_9ACTN